MHKSADDKGSDFLMAAIKSHSLNRKTKLIKTEKFQHQLKVIFPLAIKHYPIHPPKKRNACIKQAILDLCQEEL